MGWAEETDGVRWATGVCGEVEDCADPASGVLGRLGCQRLKGSSKVRFVGSLDLRTDVLQVPRGFWEQQKVVCVKHFVLMDQQLLTPVSHPDVPLKPGCVLAQKFSKRMFFREG
jgi:hypothetical protein